MNAKTLKKPKAPKKPKPATKRKTGARRRLEPILSTGPQARMTTEQQAQLRQLAHDGYEPDAFSEQLTQTEAATRIAMLEAKLRLQDGPPHTL